MRDIRPQFSDDEYARLRQEADELGVTLKQLVRDRALGIVTEDKPLSIAKVLCDEMAKNRVILNQIIQREVNAEERLYEDDIIRLEMAMRDLEETVAKFVRKQLREAKKHGNSTF